MYTNESRCMSELCPFIGSSYSRSSTYTPKLITTISREIIFNNNLLCTTPFIMMEYLEGDTLEDFMCKKQLNEFIFPATSIIYNLIDIIKEMHNKGRIHNDIQPKNFIRFLSPDHLNSWKIIDFEKSIQFTDKFGNVNDNVKDNDDDDDDDSDFDEPKGSSR